MKVRYKPVETNRPIELQAGWPGHTEANTTVQFFGEWVVFKLPFDDGTEGELRLPLDQAREENLVRFGISN